MRQRSEPQLQPPVNDHIRSAPTTLVTTTGDRQAGRSRKDLQHSRSPSAQQSTAGAGRRSTVAQEQRGRRAEAQRARTRVSLPSLSCELASRPPRRIAEGLPARRQQDSAREWRSLLRMRLL